MPISSGLNSDRIRVGIVLPEDHISSLQISWPVEVTVSCDELTLDPAGILDLGVKNGQLSISHDGRTHLLDELNLHCPDAVEDLYSAYGFHIESVVAGRGFHWEKRIAVDLPGRLSVSIVNNTIKLINSVHIEAYVACVATSEMGAEAPAQLLAAQTVVARCWSLALAEAKHLAQGFDVCNDDCCQRYQGTSFLTEYSLKAAVDTKGQVLVYDNAVIDARYSKNCGGMVEAYETVWEGGPVPYLISLWDGPVQRPGKAVDDFEALWGYDDAYCASKRFEGVNLAGMLGKVDVSGSYYRWEKVLSKADLLQNLKKYHGLNWRAISGIRIGERGPSARVRYLYIEGVDDKGRETEQVVRSEYGIRRMFSDSFLYSSAFIIKNSASLATDDDILLRGVGWGHGVGLCQMGALGMALDQIQHPEILAHYYPGTQLRQL